jgi:hypothetical protein
MNSVRIFLALGLLLPLAGRAQDNSYEALARTFSQPNPVGSARFQALGGTHSALGADVTTLSGNPAGLGFYTRSELSLSPSFQFNNNAATYIDNRTTATGTGLSLANVGLVLAGGNRNPVGASRWRGSLGFSYSRQANLSNTVRFGGRNIRSSQVDAFAEQATNEFLNSQQDSPNDPSQWVTPLDYRNDLYANGNVFDFPTSMYYYGLLIEPTTVNGSPYVGAEFGKTSDQSFTFTSTGGVNQLNFAYGASYADRVYLGITVGRSSLNYTTRKTLQETFVNPQAIGSFTYDNDLTTKGNGWNATVGAIFRPTDFLRIGASFSSPTWYTISESVSQSVQTNVVRPYEVSENANPEFDANLISNLSRAGFGITQQGGVNFITSVPRLEVLPFDATYQLRTPFKANGGVALFFGKAGFISGDLEYVAYQSMRFSSNDPNADAGLSDGFYNDVVRRTYRNTVNVKVGGEYRLGSISLRAGAGYYGDPYQATFDDLNRTRVSLSGGAGYRNDRFYVDLAAVHSRTQSAFSPYILADTRDYYSAKINQSTTNLVLTLGTFF